MSFSIEAQQNQRQSHVAKDESHQPHGAADT